MNTDLRKRFTENAEQFDSLMTEMLAENDRLNEVLKNRLKRDEETRDALTKAYKRLCNYEGHLPITDKDGRSWCELCEREVTDIIGRG